MKREKALVRETRSGVVTNCWWVRGLIMMITSASLGIIVPACLAASSPLNVDLWLKEAKPDNSPDLVYTGPAYDEFIPFKAANSNAINQFSYADNHDLLALKRTDLKVLKFPELTLSGFSLRSSNRDPDSVIAGDYSGEGQAPTITWTCGKDRWRQFITVVYLDSWSEMTTGNEQVSVFHNDKKVGTIFLGNRGNLKHVFPYAWDKADAAKDTPMPNVFDSTGPFEWRRYGIVFKTPVNFVKGDTLRLVADTKGHYNFTDILLLTREDSLPLMQQEIVYPEVVQWAKGERPGTLQFAWVTRLTSKGGVIYSRNRADLEAGKGTWIGEDRYSDNHQLFANETFAVGEPVYYRILAESDDGLRAATGIMEDRPAMARPVQEQKGSFALNFMDERPAGSAAAYASIPFPAGVLRDENQITLFNSKSGPISAQWRPVSKYADGSIRWLGGNFTAQADGDYSVQYGPDVAKPQVTTTGMATVESMEKISVKGPMVDAVFAKDQGGGLKSLHVKPAEGQPWNATGKELNLFMTSAEGVRIPMGAPEMMSVERSGSESVVIKTIGHFSKEDMKLFHYTARWTFYRLLPGIQLDLTVGNDSPEHREMYDLENATVTYFQNMYLEMDAGAPANCKVPASAGDQSMSGGLWKIVQKDENTAFVNGKEITSKVSGSMVGKNFAVKVDKFWQQYPKSFEVEGNKVRVGLMPDVEAGWYPGPPAFDFIKLYFYLKQGKYRFVAGVQKTHRVLLVFGTTAERTVGRDAAGFGESMLFPDPKVMCDAKVFGPLRAADDRYKIIDSYEERLLDGFLANRVSNREYGLLNFGDWYGERGVNWGNLEYDLGQGCSQQFLRNGQRRWFETGLEAVTHQTDVDTAHYGRNAGMEYMHAAAHTGVDLFTSEDGLSKADVRKILMAESNTATAPYHGVFHEGHMWCTGIANYAALTGSDRLKDVLTAFAQAKAAIACNALPFGHHRSWALVSLTSAYALEPDPFYLNGARIAFDRYAMALNPWNVMPPPDVQGSGAMRPLRALMYYRDIIGDDRYDEMYKYYSSFLLRQWNDRLWYFANGHGFRPNKIGEAGIFMGETIAEVYLLTKNPKLLDIFQKHIQAGSFSRERIGKDFSVYLQFTPWIPALLERVGIKDVPELEALPADVLQARNEGMAQWEASPFVKKGKGGKATEETDAARAQKPADAVISEGEGEEPAAGKLTREQKKLLKKQAAKGDGGGDLE